MKNLIAFIGRHIVSFAIFFIPLSVNSLPTIHKTDTYKTVFKPTSFYTNFSDTPLTDQNGKIFNLEKLHGKVVLFNFIYTQCGDICPLQTHDLVQIQSSLPRKIQDDVQFVTVSIDPKHDTPELLAVYAKRMNANLNHWAFVTGQEQGIAQLMARLHLRGTDIKESVKSPQIHSTALWLIDGTGMLMQRYSGDVIDRNRMVNELQQLSELAAGNKEK